MRRILKYAAVVILVFLGVYGGVAALKESGQAQVVRNNLDSRMRSFRTVVHEGMTRGEVRDLISKKSPFAVYTESDGAGFVLLERVPSNVWFCNYIDVSAKLTYKPDLNNRDDDKLDAISESSRLMQCL